MAKCFIRLDCLNILAAINKVGIFIPGTSHKLYFVLSQTTPNPLKCIISRVHGFNPRGVQKIQEKLPTEEVGQIVSVSKTRISQKSVLKSVAALF